jgi:hypothetical protein
MPFSLGSLRFVAVAVAAADVEMMHSIHGAEKKEAEVTVQEGRQGAVVDIAWGVSLEE